MDERGMIRVLLVEDDPYDAELFYDMLRTGKVLIDLRRASDLSSALALIAEEMFDVVVTDLGLPDSRGIGAFLMLHDLHPHIPVIVLTGLDDENLALKAVHMGAQDYLVKGLVGSNELVRSIQHSIERQKLMTELEKSRNEIKTLTGLLPICASCKKIRDDKGYWNQIETYISCHSEVVFTHGICPDCSKKLYPEVYDDIWGKQDKETDR